MARDSKSAPADGPQGVVKDEAGEVVEANLDEVVAPGDPRHGTHSPLAQERDALAVHGEKTPEQVFGSPDPATADGHDFPESDLVGEQNHQGPVIKTVSGPSPEQTFAAPGKSESKSGDSQKTS